MSARAAPLPLVAATVAMAALAIYPWALGPGAPSVPALAPREALPRVAALPPFSNFAEITARPLFSPTRRPDAGPDNSGIAARYRLLGIVIAGNARHALLMPVAGGAVLELAEGATLEGWSVGKIEGDRVLLTSPTGTDASLVLKAPAPTR